MKEICKTFVTIVAFVMFLTFAGFVGKCEVEYTRKGIVTNVCNNIVTIEDEYGKEWEIEDNGYNVNDEVTMTIHTNYTNKISDDIIKKVVDK